MRVFIYWGTQIGFGFAIWEAGAEIFLPYIMVRLVYKGNKFLRVILRPSFWLKSLPCKRLSNSSYNT
uniref:Uncharacterized protein n=1 Tax=viral metagenome TaxID=1070528 RepID=A0A6M3JJ23_9ZZZZ